MGSGCVEVSKVIFSRTGKYYYTLGAEASAAHLALKIPVSFQNCQGRGSTTLKQFSLFFINIRSLEEIQT